MRKTYLSLQSIEQPLLLHQRTLVFIEDGHVGL
jgi:hypothetical protein